MDMHRETGGSVIVINGGSCCRTPWPATDVVADAGEFDFANVSGTLSKAFSGVKLERLSKWLLYSEDPHLPCV